MNHEARLLEVQSLANHYQQIKIDCPTLGEALPGQFVWLETYRLYILSQSQSQIEFIIPPTLAAKIKNKMILNISDLQGEAIKASQKTIFYLIVADTETLSAVIFYLKKYRADFKGFVLIGTQTTFPFLPCPSKHVISALPADLIAAIPLLEDWGIANRLASKAELPGVFQGEAHSLADLWLSGQQKYTPKEIKIISFNKLSSPPPQRIVSRLSKFD